LNQDSLTLDMPVVSGKFRARILSDTIMDGQWFQGGNLGLRLHKVEKIVGSNRPQTPIPPFPYQVKEVEFDNQKTKLHYGATITIPEGKGPFAALLLITGSGAQDRDETIMSHKPFAVLADYLTRQGLIVMRVDDRGMGKSTGDFSKSTSADFAVDVSNSLDYLKAQPKVDQHKLGLMGHSEGGMIAPMVAADRHDIDFIILLAGPGEKIGKLMEEQNAGILLSAGINKDAVQSFRNFYPNIIDAVTSSDNPAVAEEKINQALDSWRKTTPKNHVLATTGIYDDSSQVKYVNAMTQVMYNPWFLYFLRFDPAPYLEKLDCKVFALNGEKDLQVVPHSNLEGIKQALQKSKSKSFEVHEIPGLNHLFQTCKKCTIQEYGQLEETFSPVALKMIGDWIGKEIK
jgi:uncharacterized protein